MANQLDANKRRTINLLGMGSLALTIPQLVDQLNRFGVADSILAAGIGEFNRNTFEEQMQWRELGILNVGPGIEDIKNSAGYLADANRAEADREVWEPAGRRMIDQVVAAQMDHELKDGTTLWFQSISSGHTLPGEVTLSYHKRQLESQITMAYTVIPHELYLRENIKNHPTLFVDKKQDEVVDTTLVSDNLSPLADKHGLATQDGLILTALSSVIAAGRQRSNQRALPDFIRAMGLYAAFVGCSVATRILKTDPEIGWYKPIRQRFGLKARSTGNINSLIVDAKSAIDEVISQESAKTIKEPITINKQAFLALTVPMKLDDPRWEKFSANIRDYLHRQAAWIAPLFCSGTGYIPRSVNASYMLQASLFFALEDTPETIQAIMDKPVSRRRRGNKPEESDEVQTPAFMKDFTFDSTPE